MAQLKTVVNDASVEAYLNSIEHPVRQQDARTVFEMYSSLFDETPRMWGDSIIGFGTYTYRNTTGKDQTWMRSAFSARKNYLSLYVMAGLDAYPELLAKLGKHKRGRACLNINKLADIDLEVLKQLVMADRAVMDERYPQHDG